MADHRPSSYGLQAPWHNRGPTTAALTGQFFFLNPLPEFTPRRTTCGDEVITEDSFSPSKISPGLRCLILLLYPEHIKTSPPSNGIICMKGKLPNNLSPTLPFNLQSRAGEKRGGRKKGHKKGEEFLSELPKPMHLLLPPLLLSFFFTSSQTTFFPLL